MGIYDNLTPIITVDEMQELTTVEALETIDEWKLQKMINQITSKVWTVIDEKQFEEVWIPDDLKTAVASLVDNFYTFSKVNKQSVASGRRTSYSEKVDDYQITESYSDNTTNVFDFFWIPVDRLTLMVLMSYMDEEVWFWNVNLH